jgi:hypothetical protein
MLQTSPSSPSTPFRASKSAPAGLEGLQRRRALFVAFVITGLDRENASFEKALASIREAFGINCVPVTAPESPTSSSTS